MTSLPLQLARLSLAICGVALLASPLDAQAPLNKPSFAITRMPLPFYHNLWPGDFNRDGRTDIVLGTAEVDRKLVILLGNGDGTFAPARDIVSGFAFPLGVADFNEDSRPDLLAADHSLGRFRLLIILGNGDGTFGPVHIVDELGDVIFGLTADFDEDGHLDIISGHGEGVVYAVPGNGDGTFGARVEVFTGPGPFQGIAADLNGDTRPDVALVDRSQHVHVLINGAGLTFTSTAIPFDRDVDDLTVWDMDGDGDRDLVVSGGRVVDNPVRHVDGRIWILENNGSGTFGTPVPYDTLPGPLGVVAGDFNRDDVPDVATVNRSAVWDPACRIVHFGDSVSVFPGLGSGTLGAATSFLLAQGNTPVDNSFRSQVTWLNTADLDGDRETDLIVSPGALLLNRPEGMNTEPTVSAGADSTINERQVLRLRGSATDADFDWLTYRWTNAAGQLLSTLPQACLSNYPAGTHEFTLAVNDGRGGMASDVVRHTLLQQIDDEFDSGDIGTVSARGFSSRDGDSLVVTGSGFDIWGSGDEFHYVHQQRTGDFAVATRVASVQNLHRWVKAGLMVRETLSPRSRHASLFATPTTEKGLAFQRRTVTAGESTHTAGPALAPPLWLGVTRIGNTVSAYYRQSTAEDWTLIGSETFTDLPATVYVGLAVGSHVDGRLATARFDHFAVISMTDWSAQDIGTVGRAGRTTLNGLVVEMEGGGADIWGTTDAFHYASIARSGDVTITARIRSLENTHRWAKAGVMIRDGLDASAPQVMLIVSAARGIAMQFRGAAGGTTVGAALRPGAAPAWVRLVRSGTTFTGFVSEDGVTWTQVGTVAVAMAESVRAGLAVTSHNNATLASAIFDGVSVQP